MIRPLHIEPPKLALPSEKSNESEDSTARESIAAEFKKLLDKARSGISGARDEVVALGMALSQAVSTVKHQQVELQKVDDANSVEESDEAVGEVEDIEGDSGPLKGVDTLQDTSRALQVGPERERVREDDEDTSADITASEDSLIDAGGLGNEIALDDEVVYTDLTNFTDETEVADIDLKVNTHLEGVLQKQNDADVATTLATESDVEVGPGLVDRLRFHSSTEGDVEEEEGVVDEYFDDTKISSHDNVGALRNQLKSMLSKGASGNEGAASEVEAEQSAAHNETSLNESWNAQKNDPSGRLLNPGGDVRGGSDLDRSIHSAKNEGPSWLRPAALEAFAQTKDQNGELSMQLSLLRQAYESLRAQTHGQADAKPRAQTGSISGVGASSEMKRAENDTAPRAARYINRATAQRMMERIESALKEAARSRDGKTISLKLDPVQLGQVKCDVSIRDGVLHARIIPQNSEVLQTVREHSHELQGALRRLGLNVDRVTVQVTGDNGTAAFPGQPELLDGKSFQQERNNMPHQSRQTPEMTSGNDLADVSRADISGAGITPADHWIA